MALFGSITFRDRHNFCKQLKFFRKIETFVNDDVVQRKSVVQCSEK